MLLLLNYYEIQVNRVIVERGLVTPCSVNNGGSERDEKSAKKKGCTLTNYYKHYDTYN